MAGDWGRAADIVTKITLVIMDVQLVESADLLLSNSNDVALTISQESRLQATSVLYRIQRRGRPSLIY